MSPLALAALTVQAAALAGWLVVLLARARAWDLQPIAEDAPEPPEPPAWPRVHVLVPAHDEALSLPETLPALLAQDYPGPWRAILVDDRSRDGTATVARRLAAGDPRLTVLEGGALPAGWVGKVWALEQAAAESALDLEPPAYLLLTDADIRHAPGSLARLVAESESSGLALNSRMARLRCVSGPERLLIPPFVFFFNLLYPQRRVNDPASRVAAAAGGCVLIRRDSLERAGGLAAIRGEPIDDVNLGQRVKALGEPIRLSVSRSDVASVREYGSIGAVWRMVRRTAFDELRYSWALLAGTLAALAVLFVAPPAGLAGAMAAAALGAPAPACTAVGALALAAWAAATAAFVPATRYFALGLGWALTLPLAGVLFGGMTLDSALRSRPPA
ncbi:MAG: glycosyltransferase [Thermoleophilia bacterium]|nr:glycosyltransferase [Thermoleophilia bacterium]